LEDVRAAGLSCVPLAISQNIAATRRSLRSLVRDTGRATPKRLDQRPYEIFEVTFAVEVEPQPFDG
jgi:hypothetical protein